MSDQNTQIDEATIDPAIKAYFEQKFAPVVAKRDELLGKVGTAAQLKAELDALGGLETLKTLKQKADDAAAEAEKARIAALTKDGDKAALEAHYKKLLEDKDAAISKRDQRLINKEVEVQLAAAIAAAEGSSTLLLPHLKGRVEGRLDENGDVVIIAKGAAGQTLDNLNDLVAEFKGMDAFGAAFTVTTASGAGGKKSTDGVTGDNPFAKNTFNATKQSELITTQPALAKKMAQAAGWKAEEIQW